MRARRGHGWAWAPDPGVDTYNNGSHDITLFESFLGTRGMRIVTSDAGIRDGQVGRKSLRLVTIFEGDNPG